MSGAETPGRTRWRVPIMARRDRWHKPDKCVNNIKQYQTYSRPCKNYGEKRGSEKGYVFSFSILCFIIARGKQTHHRVRGDFYNQAAKALGEKNNKMEKK